MEHGRLTRLYPAAVAAAGGVVISHSIWVLTKTPPDPVFYLLAAVTALSGWATLRMPDIPISFSISDSFTITAALLFGPAAGALIVAFDSLVISLRLTRRELTAKRFVFNATVPALAMWMAAHVFFLVAGTGPLRESGLIVPRVLASLVIFAAAYFILNTGLIAGAIACERRESPLRVWRQHFPGLWLSYFGGAAFAVLMLSLLQSSHDLVGVALAAPIPFVLYATFKSVIGRMQDRVAHLQQVNQMHLATIETLAHAIDAKDQITHGHIRRVQSNAMRLAQVLGVSDEADLRALEAASLLHDIGKLAIPEHILGNPGTLTPAEFEKMKTHASIGAEILTSVNFPFPAVPIVRHHHENWDGSGYPAGLCGEAIPIGARILAVVDCYDALTSDRPYRRKLTAEEALRILGSRRGTMYDPRVVDKFVAIHRDLVQEEVPSGAVLLPLPQQDRSAIPTGHTWTADALAALIDLGSDLTAANGAAAAVGRVYELIRRNLPASTIVVYTHSPDSDALVATVAVGDYADAITGLTIPLGQRITGWVGANRRTIVNADAALDLGNVAMNLKPIARACLSAPICAGTRLTGVLTVYSAEAHPFSQHDASMLEAVAGRLSAILQADPSLRRLVRPTAMEARRPVLVRNK